MDDDFLALYQMNYGFTEASTPASAGKEADDGDKKETSDEQLGVKRKAGPQEPSKFVLYDSCCRYSEARVGHSDQKTWREESTWEM